MITLLELRPLKVEFDIARFGYYSGEATFETGPILGHGMKAIGVDRTPATSNRPSARTTYALRAHAREKGDGGRPTVLMMQHKIC